MMVRILAILFISMALLSPALAVEPDEVLEDPVLEARARDLSKQLRCVVCQNQDIDSSNAGVARDLRLLVRERLVVGDTDAEVLAYIVDRYGDYVLFRPPWKPTTYALWLAPLVLLIIGGSVVGTILFRRRETSKSPSLDASEEAAFSELMANLERDAK